MCGARTLMTLNDVEYIFPRSVKTLRQGINVPCESRALQGVHAFLSVHSCSRGRLSPGSNVRGPNRGLSYSLSRWKNNRSPFRGPFLSDVMATVRRVYRGWEASGIHRARSRSPREVWIYDAATEQSTGLEDTVIGQLGNIPRNCTKMGKNNESSK